MILLASGPLDPGIQDDDKYYYYPWNYGWLRNSVELIKCFF